MNTVLSRESSLQIPKLPRCSRGWRRSKKTGMCKKKRCKNGTRKFLSECRKYPFPKKRDKYLYQKFLNKESLTVGQVESPKKKSQDNWVNIKFYNDPNRGEWF